MDVPAFLESLSPAELRAVWDRSRVRDLKAKEILFFEGEAEAHPTVVLDGYIRLERNTADGSRAVLGLRGPGEVLGELPMLDGGPQPYEANALGPSRVLQVGPAIFERTVASNPGAAASIAAGLSLQVRWSYEVCSDRISGAAKARVAGRILDVADVLGRVRDGAIEMAAPITQSDLAAMSGVCRESATRVVSDLKRQGAIAYSGRTLRVLRPDVLERIKCAGRAAGSSRSRRVATSRRSR